MEFTFAHNNFNVLDLEKSLKFYEEALGLKEDHRKVAADGSFILVYLTDGKTPHLLELTWLRDRKEAYNLGENEFHLAFWQMITKQRMLSISKWAASATKILLWEFTLLPTLIIIGWKLYRRTNKRIKKRQGPGGRCHETQAVSAWTGSKKQAQLLNLAKRLLPGSTVKVKIKEKYFNDNDMYKYRLTRFTPENIDGVRLYCAWGALLVSDKLLAIADIIIEFEYHNAEAAEAVDSLLQKLLASKTKFVLEEPDFSQRLDQLRGCFDQKQLAAYDADSAMSLLYCHLPWQVYYVSKLWQEVLSRGPERSLLRQLRVKLRRLRSLLTLCKPLLPEQEAVHWQGVLKASTNRLGDVREYDVALQICSRLQRSREQAEAALPQLTALLTQLRGTAAAKALRGLRLNRLTLELARLLLWLYSVPAPERELTLSEFLSRRFGNWYDKLMELPEKYPDLHNMEQLHRIRIKLKRFRYALQSVPELAPEARLLRSLKYLQDMLGLLHDDYINTMMVEKLVAAHPKIKELRYEAALFSGWEQAKADAALEALPQQWEAFSSQLTEWKNKNL